MKKTFPSSFSRPDIVGVKNNQLSEALEARIQCGVSNMDRDDSTGKAHNRMLIRQDLIESEKSDPNGYERMIGESDLTSVNFLDRGRRAAAAVCRIKIPMDGGFSYGTGFLVGARLLITNNHVIGSVLEASQVEAEFGYENDAEGVLSEPVQFNLRPGEIFFTDSAMDFTVVAVAPFSESGVPIERFGRLPLIPVSGKGVNGEWVSIVQHPNGQPKQIAIRASQIIELDAKSLPEVDLESFIHYSTDTEPGSSGSPVFNDQWQVVALHHKAVPAPAKRGVKGENSVAWIANEGVRVSAIFNRLSRARLEDDSANSALNRISATLGLPPAVEEIAQPRLMGKEQFAAFPLKRWVAPKLGYDDAFLSKQISIDAICKRVRKKKLTVPLLDGTGDELKYKHFSVVMQKERKFALLTAVNIHGAKLIHPGPRKDTWRPDDRIGREYQPDDQFYVRTKAEEKVYFSRGHLVRLLDPCWGENQDEAKNGQEDTFHFTNAAPQFQKYNDSDWGNLEDYLLDRAQDSEKKLTIFTGPIYRKDDPYYGRKRKGGPWQIPLSYWKIAILQKTSTKISAAAFIVGQTEYVQALYEAKVFSGLKPYTADEMRSRGIQTTIKAVEKETGLDFSLLYPFDIQGNLESTRQTRWVNSLSDIQI